jgi:hypothetical protein
LDTAINDYTDYLGRDVASEKRREVGDGAKSGEMIGRRVLNHGIGRDLLGGENHTNTLVDTQTVKPFAHHGGQRACVTFGDVGGFDL